MAKYASHTFLVEVSIEVLPSNYIYYVKNNFIYKVLNIGISKFFL